MVLVLSQQLDFQRNNSFVLSFKTFSGDINVTWRSILSVACMCRKIVLAIKFWFKVDYCLCIVLSNTYWIVFLFCCSSSCTPYVVNCSGLFNLDCPFGILQRFFPYVKGYRSFFTELIYYTYDICHDYYLYDMHRDQDWESRVLYNNASVLLTRGKRLHGCFSSLRDECLGPWF